MSSAEIKYNLHQLIDNINDSATLNALYAVLSNSKSNSKVRLSKDEKKAVQEAKKQVANGKVISHDDVIAEMRNKFSFHK